jgi:hypothetical protein
LLGRDGPPWELLRSAPDPQARSFLIATLGPAGVAPQRLMVQLEDPLTSTSVRMALIQSLGDIAENAWPPDLRAGVVRSLLRIYRDDPDAGVHGAAKWLLLRWLLGTEIDRIDRELAGERRSDPRFGWRISRERMTLVTVDDPALERVLEVSDSEVTVEMFRRFRPNFEFAVEFSDEAACPINSTSYYEAAAFCNWLCDREGIDLAETCYRATEMKDPAYLPRPEHLERAGFRLPTAREFDVFCAAGTRTRRYYGDTNLLLDRYARTLNSQDGKSRPVAGKIPNDLGIFDTLGNMLEWCECDQPINAEGRYTADVRGGWFGSSPASSISRKSAFRNVYQENKEPVNGFRVVRTKSAR